MGYIQDIIIETPKGSRNKYAYDKKKKLFTLKKILPQGMVFPFDFGFVPGTKGEDGDPVDVLVIMDEPAYPGILVKCRIIGAIKATQKKKGKAERNDRIIAISDESAMYEDIQDIANLNVGTLHEIEHFFISYNEEEGKEFRILGRCGAPEAMRLIKKGKK